MMYVGKTRRDTRGMYNIDYFWWRKHRKGKDPSKHLSYCGQPSGNLLVQDETVLLVRQQYDSSTIAVR